MRKWRSPFYMGRLTLTAAALALCGVLIVLAISKLRQPMYTPDHVDNGSIRNSAKGVLRDL